MGSRGKQTRGKVVTGLERVVSGDVLCLGGKRIGLLANPTAVDRQLRHAADLFGSAPDIQLTALFGPEHGIRGAAQDMVSVDSQVDSATGVMVHSLYGDSISSLVPDASVLDQLDAFVFDIQDVGARYYTYVWTLVKAMRACAQAGLQVVVLDRPNPIGGVLVEGGGVAADFRSFVGLCPVPNRHGMTVGEIAIWVQKREALDVDLVVVPMQGWSRSMYFSETGLPWVMPSPNMPTEDTAIVYPGMCLLEGTLLSEGRGTTRPFEIVGAPFVDGGRLVKFLDKEELPGVILRPLRFIPTFHKFKGEVCGGVQIHVTQRETFRPYLTGVALLRAVYQLWPDFFRWRTEAYEFETDQLAIDLLAGTDAIRVGIEARETLDTLAASWKRDQEQFIEQRRESLLY